VGKGRCIYHPASADALLRSFLSVLFLRSGGALFHAAAVRIGGAGVLFPGISGAGKTTIAGKVGDAETTLSDELSPVRREADGAWRVYGSPFWGGYARGGPSLRGWPLVLVAFPRKGEHLAVSPLSPAETAQRLLAALLCYESGGQVASEALAFATRLAADVSGIELTTARATRSDAVRKVLQSCLASSRIAGDPPATRRERIGELRVRLERDGAGAFIATGDSMRPTIRPGDTVFVETAGADNARPGDLLLHWQPGRGPDDDILVCHRAVGRFGGGGSSTLLTKGDNAGSFERFRDGREAAVLGRVVSVCRDGTSRPVAGRARRLARLAGSLVALPLQRYRERSGARARRRGQEIIKRIP
jgi:hypothetical protein